MLNIKNSCGKKRGCDVTVILPHDSGIRIVSSRVLSKSDDTKKILSLPKLSLDKELEKAA